jgi:hypothetical protein
MRQMQMSFSTRPSSGRRKGSRKCKKGSTANLIFAGFGSAVYLVAIILLVGLILVIIPAIPPRPFKRLPGCRQDQEVVVSLATVAQRLKYPFPVSMRALLRQSASACATYWVFIPESNEVAAETAFVEIDEEAKRVGRRVYIQFVPDRMSANKFLWSLEALSHPESGSYLPGNLSTTMDNSSRSNVAGGFNLKSSNFRPDGTSWRPVASKTRVLGLTKGESQPSTEQLQAEVGRLRKAEALLFICDDDWLHHPRLLEILLISYTRLKLEKSKTSGTYPESIGDAASTDMDNGKSYNEIAIGTRGYRIRQDLKWGVDPKEFRYHVIEGWQISEPYQVGVATSGKGILISPARALRSFNLSDFGSAPDGAKFVDDIWLNGHLAAAGVPRWVVPLLGSPADMQINGDSPLDRRLAQAEASRWQSNSDAIKYFEKAWESDILYVFGGANGPQYKEVTWRWVLQLRAAFSLLLVQNGLI